MINYERCLALNLIKKSNFVLTFLLKSYTTFMPLNFIDKNCPKTLHFYYTVMISEPDFKF